MYYTYIIQSEKSGVIYIGQTNNLDSRLKRHNDNKNKSTRNKGPWKIIYSKEFETRGEAMHFEKKLKSCKSREYILKHIVHFNSSEKISMPEKSR